MGSLCTCVREGYHHFYQVSRLSLYGRPWVRSLPIGEAHGAGQGCSPGLPLDQCDMHFRPEPGSLPQDDPGSGVVAPWLLPGQLHGISSTSVCMRGRGGEAPIHSNHERAQNHASTLNSPSCQEATNTQIKQPVLGTLFLHPLLARSPLTHSRTLLPSHPSSHYPLTHSRTYTRTNALAHSLTHWLAVSNSHFIHSTPLLSLRPRPRRHPSPLPSPRRVAPHCTGPYPPPPCLTGSLASTWRAGEPSELGYRPTLNGQWRESWAQGATTAHWQPHTTETGTANGGPCPPPPLPPHPLPPPQQ